ncbi:MAG: glycosyltransferase family 4 protein [Anaerolineae bacterium]|nr:glycosyltransferase family 4 protein [Anaerolineae bacterium]
MVYNDAVSESLPAHVGLNASLLSLGENYRGAGINWYIYDLLCHLPDADPVLRYTAFLSEARFCPPPGLEVRRSAWSTQSPIKRIAWEQLIAPWALRRERVDVLHAMAFVSPVLSRLPTVITVFDLSFLKFPQAFQAANRFYLRTMTRLSVRRAEQVIAISEYTRQDVINRLGVPAERVQTVYCGVDPTFVPLSRPEIDAFKAEKGLPERFVLFLGTIEPRKNVVRLIEAFAALAKHLSDVDLVVAGGKGWFFDPVFARVQELGLTDRVHFPGYVPEAEKRLWYNAAEVFCYPSLYEGFGLPPLEAMACGTPVIVSTAASLPEVVGEAGIAVDPQDTPGLSEAMHSLLDNASFDAPSLRAELSEKGSARARRFTWPEAARQTTQIYHLARRQASLR